MRIFCAFLIFALLLGCRRESPQEIQQTRPVKVMTLAKTRPERALRLTGSAKAWRQENLAFEITGRVENVLDEEHFVGLAIQPDENNNLRVVGQVIAELDSSRYLADEAFAQAQLESARAQAKAIQKEISEIIPHDIERAKSRVESLEVSLQKILPQELQKARIELESSRREMERVKRLYEQDNKSEREYDQAQTQYEITLVACKIAEANIPFQERQWEAAKAELQKAKAAASIAEAQLEAARAREKMTEVQLSQARRNRRECKLRTPFSGVISARLVSRGAMVGPLQPVVSVTIMDPVLVEVAVSAEMARILQTGDPVRVFPSTLDAPIAGWVQQKSVAADPSTRTYNVTCMVRNHLIAPRGGNLQRKDNLLAREDTSVVWQANAADVGSSLMVWTDSVLKDEAGYFVWCIADFHLGQQKVDCREVAITKIPVELGEGVMSFGVRYFREVKKNSRLDAGMLTLRKDLPNLRDGGKVIYVPSDWVIHPGDLVPVSFDFGNYPEGIYIPLEAILQDDKGHYLFLYDRSSGKALKVRVDVEEAFRDTRKVRAKEDLEGKELIVRGAHYVKDNDSVVSSPLETYR